MGLETFFTRVREKIRTYRDTVQGLVSANIHEQPIVPLCSGHIGQWIDQTISHDGVLSVSTSTSSQDVQSSQETIRVASIDMDGCVFNSNYIRLKATSCPISERQSIITANKYLLDFLRVSRTDILILGSNRQSEYHDAIHARRSESPKGTASGPFALEALAKILDCYTQKMMLGDFILDRHYGYCYDFLLEHGCKDSLSEHTEEMGKVICNPCQICNELYKIMDGYKTNLLLTQMQHFASLYSDRQIQFDFFDDWDVIHESLIKDMSNMKDLIPHNVTLTIYKYTGEKMPEKLFEIKGECQPDQTRPVVMRM